MQIIFYKQIEIVNKNTLIHYFQNEPTVINKLNPLSKVEKNQKTKLTTKHKSEY